MKIPTMKSIPWTSLLFLLASSTTAVDAIQFSNPRGPFAVGTTALELIDTYRPDASSPTLSPRDLMISLFYPTPNNEFPARYGEEVQPCVPVPEFPPQTAAIVGSSLGIPNANVTVAALRTESCPDVPFLENANSTDGKFPLLMFSPGLGIPRLAYSAIAEDLASRGYIVVTIDHPYQAIVVEYPDGRLVFSPPANATGEVEQEEDEEEVDEYLARALEVRIKDIAFVHDQLRNGNRTGLNASTVFAEMRNHADFSRVGVFGHSFGATASASVMLNDSCIRCGALLDGQVSGPVVEAGLDQPVLLMAAEGNIESGILGWNAFLPNLRGFYRQISINGSVHGAFSDGPLIFDALGLSNATEFQDFVGNIDGSRMFEIQNAYLDDFFEGCLKGGNYSLLTGPSSSFPEVQFYL